MAPGQRAPGEAEKRPKGLEAGDEGCGSLCAPKGQDGQTFFAAVVSEKNELKVPEHLPRASGASLNQNYKLVAFSIKII